MLPKISCLTVTESRLILLKQAIQCYLHQTYPNKELVIVADGAPLYKDAIKQYVSFLKRPDIRLILLEQRHNLGQLRNISIEEAHGPIIIQWDDDDLYHPKRLELQYNYLTSQKADACLLSDQLSFFEQSREMYWVNWVPHSNFPMHQVFPGSIMAVKDSRFRYPEEGQYSIQGEDSIFLSQYYEKAKMAALSGKGFIYVYRYHGKNTFPKEHHQWVAKGHVCTPAFVNEKLRDLMPALSYYPLPQPLTFRARNDQSLFIFRKNK